MSYVVQIVAVVEAVEAADIEVEDAVEEEAAVMTA